MKFSKKSWLPENLIIVGRDTPHVAGEHVLFDVRGLRPPDPENIKSLEKQGLMQPPVVHEDGDKAYVVDGRGRVIDGRELNKARAKAGLKPMEFDCNVTPPGTSSAELGAMVLAANLRRMEMSSMDVAHQLYSAMTASGYENPLEEPQFMSPMMSATSLTKEGMQRLLNYRGANPAILKAFRDGIIAETSAIDLAQFASDKQVEMLKKLQAEAKQGRGGKITVAQTRNMTAAAAGEERKLTRDVIKRMAHFNHKKLDVVAPSDMIALQAAVGLESWEKVPGLKRLWAAMDKEVESLVKPAVKSKSNPKKK